MNFSHIHDETTAEGVWSKLRGAFEDSGLRRRVGLLRTLITTKLDSCENMEDFVNKIISSAQKLKGAGMVIDDEWVATLLLAGLSERYEPMIMAIESSGLKISSDQIKTKLLQEVRNSKKNGENSLFTRNTYSTHNTHNKTSGHGQYSHGQRNNTHHKTTQRIIKCYNCGKPGHFARNCPNQSNPQHSNSQQSNRQNHETNFICLIAKSSSSTNWYVDSGASAHMTGQQELVSGKRASSATVTVRVGSKVEKVNVNDVLVVPNLCTNLLSVSKMVQNNLRVEFTKTGCCVWNQQGVLVATASLVNGLYCMDLASSSMSLSAQHGDMQDLWHRRLGHIGVDNLKRMRDLVEGVKFDENGAKQCEICVLGKHARLPFRSSNTKTTSVLELVHSDVCGPMQERSLQSSRYFVTFIDDFSRKVYVYCIEYKSMVMKMFEDFKLMVETQTGKKIRTLRTDNGTEYTNGAMQEFLRSAGIVHQTTVPYTPQQNGVAERMNRTLVEKARCMMYDAKLPVKFWAEAVCTAAYIVNRLPFSGGKKSPEELWTGRKPDLSNIRVFGCKSMSHIPREKRGKFDPKSKAHILVGYSSTSKGYRLYDIASKKIIISRDVTFFEDLQEAEKIFNNKMPTLNHYHFVINPNSNEEEDNRHPASEDQVTEADAEAANDDSDDDDDFEETIDDMNDPDYVPDPEEPPVVVSSPWRSSRVRRPVVRDGFVAEVAVDAGGDPATVEDALGGANAERWMDAMDAEMKSLMENNTWSLVELPEGRKAISNKWVLKKKLDANGNIDRYKARLVVKGCSQRQGIDYQETFSPVVRYSSIRFLLAMAAKLNLDIDQMDAVTAFLQGESS